MSSSAPQPSLFPQVDSAHTRSLTTDRRRIDYTPRPELIGRAGSLVKELRRIELELGATLAELDSSRAQVAVGAATVEQLASRFGLAPEEARRYRDLGRAAAVQPSIAERVANGALPTTRAAVLAPVLDGSGEPQGEFDRILGVLPAWVQAAERTSTRKLRRMVRREMTQRTTGEALVDLTFHATETTREHFERARVLASRRAGKTLTSDQTFRVVVEHYVDDHDPLAVSEGTRRVEDTAQRPEDRYVPVSTRRGVRRRADDCCEHPACDQTVHLEFAHRIAHRDNGSREQDNLLLLCWLHHRIFDSGDVRLVGPTDEPAWVEPGIGGDHGIVCTKRVPGGRGVETDEERRALRELLAERKRESPGDVARGPP